MRKERMVALVIVFGLVLFPSGARAQSATTGSIAGVVRDARLALAWSLHENPGGIVLFGSVNPSNIQVNCAVANDASISFDQVRAFAGMVSQHS